MSIQLPPQPSLEHLKKQAKDLLKAVHEADANAIERVRPYFSPSPSLQLADAQLVIAREYGFASWTQLKEQVDGASTTIRDELIGAALEGRADEVRAKLTPDLKSDPAVAAVIGQRAAVEAWLAEHSVAEHVPPLDRPLMGYVCFSKLAHEDEFRQGLLDTFNLLLDRGADPNWGYMDKWGDVEYRPTLLYGASGILNNPEMTRRLLEAGADPNDGAIDNGVYRGESIYHACDHRDHKCLELLLQANPHQAAKDYCIKHMLDWEDLEGVRIFLKYGSNPNGDPGRPALHHAILRGRSRAMAELLLDHGADPSLKNEDGIAPYALARRLGHGEVAAAIAERGGDTFLGPVDRLIVAASEGNEDDAKEVLREHPDLVSRLVKDDRMALREFARMGNVKGIEILLEAGLSIDDTNDWGETMLHWACVAGQADAVQFLLERGARTDGRDIHHKALPAGWALWGSQFWHEHSHQYPRIAKLLVQHGAEMDPHDRESENLRKLLES